MVLYGIFLFNMLEPMLLLFEIMLGVLSISSMMIMIYVSLLLFLLFAVKFKIVVSADEGFLGSNPVLYCKSCCEVMQ